MLQRAARAYVAGPELEDGLLAVRKLQQRGFASSLGFWDGGEDSPRSVADACLQALTALPEAKLDCYLSIKLPALQYSRDLLGEVVSAARRSSIRIHFDSLGPETVDRTFAILDQVIPDYSNISFTLPGRWRRSLRDADWAMERGVRVRIVKGQWADESNLDETQGFLAVVRHLSGRAKVLDVATHDPQLARQSLNFLKCSGTAGEVELLYGLPSRRVLALSEELKTPVRFYVPYGHAWLPYCLSQAQKRPRILWWMLKDAVFAGVSTRG